MADDDTELAELRADAAMLHKLATDVPAMIAYWDADRRCRFATRAYEAWFGAAAGSLAGTRLADLPGAAYDADRRSIEGVLAGEPQVFERVMPRVGNGPARHGRSHLTPDVEGGAVLGFVVFVVDVTERKVLEQQLSAALARSEDAATHDALTGLPNRVLVDDRLGQALTQAERNGTRGALMMIDLDRFKLVNDTHGHAAGDAVLREVATRLTRAVRRSDTVARLGGDEFIVLAPNILGVDAAEIVARKLLEEIANAPILAGTVEIDIGISIGIAIFPDHGLDATALFAMADRAMYEVKRAGRNGYAVAPGPDELPPKRG